MSQDTDRMHDRLLSEQSTQDKSSKKDSEDLTVSAYSAVDEIDESEENLAEAKKWFRSFNVDENLTSKNIVKKVIHLSLYSLQNLLYNSSLFVIMLMNMYYVTSWNDSELVAGYGLASTFFAAFGYAVIYAFNYGMQALGSQAYGAGNFELAGLVFQRGLLVNLAYVVAMSPLYIYLRVVLGWLSIETLEEIQDFSRWMLIAVFIITVERSFRTYLSIHREYTIPTYCAVISYFLHPLWLYLLCDLADMRLKGIAIAMAITELFILVSSFIIATAMKKYQKTWFGFSRQALSGWWGYMKFAFSVGASSYIEWFSFEVQTVIIGILNDSDQMAAHSAQASLILFYFMIPLSLNQTIGTYLGNAAGAGKVRLSKNLIKITVCSIILLSLIMVAVGWFMQPVFMKIYTENDRMEGFFITINSIYVFFFMPGDNLQGIFQGILRSIGLDGKANVIFFFTFFLTGNALSAVFVHPLGMGAKGAWWADGIAAYLAVALLSLLLVKSDIKKCVEKTAERIKQDGIDSTIEKVKIIERSLRNSQVSNSQVSNPADTT